MSDYWVKSLTYELESQEDIVFRDCPRLGFANQLGHFVLEDGKLTVTLQVQRFDSLDEARRQVQLILDAWNVKTRLNHWNSILAFRYLTADMEPKIPPSPGSDVLYAEGAVYSMSISSAKLTSTRSTYPEPPTGFGMNPDVHTLWARYAQCLSGNEPLQGMANYVDTYLDLCDRRRRFGVSKPVQEKLGHLASTRGDPLTARKANAISPMTAHEEEWLKAAVREIIRRAGQHAAGIKPDPLTMDKLPSL